MRVESKVVVGSDGTRTEYWVEPTTLGEKLLGISNSKAEAAIQQHIRRMNEDEVHFEHNRGPWQDTWEVDMGGGKKWTGSSSGLEND